VSSTRYIVRTRRYAVRGTRYAVRGTQCAVSSRPCVANRVTYDAYAALTLDAPPRPVPYGPLLAVYRVPRALSSPLSPLP